MCPHTRASGVPELLQNLPTANAYTDALKLGPVKNCKQLNFLGIGQPFFVTLWKPDPNDPTGTPVEEGAEREYPANGSDVFQNVAGAKFRSKIAGQPAYIYGALAYATDPLSLGAGVTSAIITSSGQITPPSNVSAELGYAQVTANVTINGAAVPIVSLAPITFDGASAVLFEFYCPTIVVPNDTSAVLIGLYEDGVLLCNLAVGALGAAEAAGDDQVAGTFTLRKTPTAAAHTYSVKGTIGGAANATVRAGTGVAGANAPAFLRASTA